MEGQKIWAHILASVKREVSASTFKTWFIGSRALEFKVNGNGGILVVGLKNNFIREQLENRYLATIKKTLAKNQNRSLEIVFVVQAETNLQKTVSAPLFSGVAPTVASWRASENLNPNHTFENFVVGASNNLAYLAFAQAMEHLGSMYNPLFVWGATGVGKTHLLQACGNEILIKNNDLRVLYVSAERFTNDYIGALGNKSMATFRQKYRGVDLLLVDDAQFLSGKEGTQDEFFYTFNELCLSGRQVVLAADRHPREIPRVQERLVSRFMGGMTVDIGKPEMELKMAVLEAKCRERAMVLDRAIIEYIAGAASGGIRELEGVLVQVFALLKMTQGHPDLGEIKKIVGKSQKTAHLAPTPGRVIEAVARHFKVSIEDLCGVKRKARLVRARQTVMYLLRSQLNLPLQTIGQLIGGRDHSTVIYGIGKISRGVELNPAFRDEVTRIQMGFGP